MGEKEACQLKNYVSINKITNHPKVVCEIATIPYRTTYTSVYMNTHIFNPTAPISETGSENNSG
jgi:hypothetical protein